MRKNTTERGSAFLLSIIVLIIILGISAAYLSFTAINSRKTANDMFALQSLYIAESGAAMFIHKVNQKIGASSPDSLANGMAQPMAGGTYIFPTKAQGGLVDFGSNTVDDNKDLIVDDPYEKSFIQFQVVGSYAGMTRKLEILLTRTAGGVYWNAIFAGNNSGLPYLLNLSGPGSGVSGLNSDIVWGDIYSDTTIQASNGAQFRNVDGSLPSGSKRPVAAYGDQFSPPVDTSSQPNPDYQWKPQDPLDIQRVTNPAGGPPISTYEDKVLKNTPGYVNVRGDLNNPLKGAGVGSATGRGTARQINNASQPAHIFRQNPTQNNGTGDRTLDYGHTLTQKDDFYLEDPTQGYQTGPTITYTPAGGTPESSSAQYIAPTAGAGNNAVYFVDGNVWLSHAGIVNNKWLMPSGGMKITIVVKGNMNFTDNLYYANAQNDALAFVAIVDPAQPNVNENAFSSDFASLPNNQSVNAFLNNLDSWNSGVSGYSRPNIITTAGKQAAARYYNRAYGSGNVFFGDPGSGTVDHFEGFMYGENNFYATNLNQSGTGQIEIYGNMTAGNQVDLDRDFGNTYKPLEVRFDDKISRVLNPIVPPDLPATPGFGSGNWFIASWKQVP